MNNTVLLGRLVRDPELKYLPNGGTAVTKFNIAVDKQLSKDKKQEMENQGKPTADFINITVWGKMAESSANYLAKGKKVAIQGRIQTGSYVKDDGNKQYTFEVVAQNVEFIDFGNKEQRSSRDNSYNGFEMDDSIDSDDIPF